MDVANDAGPERTNGVMIGRWCALSLGLLLTIVGTAAPGQDGKQSRDHLRRIGFAVRGTPIVDGRVDPVWRIAPAMETDRAVTALNDPDVASPATARIRCLWDADHLYLLAEVTDRRLSAVNPSAWEQDSIEFFLDPRLDDGTQYGDDDGQYRIGLNGAATFNDPRLADDARANVTRTETGYRVELSIRWRLIDPEEGGRVGFECQVNDDAGLGRRQALMKWNSPTNRSWRDPSSFGVLWLTTRDGLQRAMHQAEAIRQRQLEPPPTDAADASDSETDAARSQRGDAFAAARVPDWVADAVVYQIFPERFCNGDPGNDPTRDSLEAPDRVPANWSVTPWTAEWYARADWERQLGSDFYENGVFDRRYGGDLQGVIDRLDYLQDLGINLIYFNPVFYARSLHKYDGSSYHHVDPYFGPDPVGDLKKISRETADPSSWNWTAADRLFLELIEQAHRRGIRIIIDGVFNHTGRDFFAFRDIIRRGPQSPYRDWYVIQHYDDPQTPENEFKYQCWWGVDTLPEFANNPRGTDLQRGPREYIFHATERWMDPDGDGDPSDGIDGWRLDVANEVPNGFWRDWNRRVRELNPQAYTVAEFWEAAGDYLADCGFSSTMNYHGFAYPVKGFLIDGRMKASDFARSLEQRLRSHPRAVQYGLLNLVDSHDTDRLASMIVNADHRWPYLNPGRFDYDVGERVSPRWFPDYDVRLPRASHRRLQRLVALFQLTYVGAPMIYYGTEVGMDGGDDPDDRMPMWWPELSYAPRTRGPRGPLEAQPIEVDSDLHAYYRALIHFRREHAALNRGTLQIVETDDAGQSIVFQRTEDQQVLIVGLNRSSETQRVRIACEALAASDASRLDSVFTSTGEDPPAARRDGDHWILELPPVYGAIWRVGHGATR